LYDPNEGDLFLGQGQNETRGGTGVRRQGQTQIVDWISRWWRQPDHYQWLSGYLAARKLLNLARFTMAAVVASLSVPPLLMLGSPSGPDTVAARITSVVIAAGCLIMASLWATRWPSRIQSCLFAAASAIAIAVTCLATAPGTGMQGCTAFAALAGYVAFFHTTRQLAFILVLGAITATACAWKIAVNGDPLQAASKLVVLVIALFAVPFAIQILVRTLGIDALLSDTDPLTDLPNRRGFRRSARILAVESSQDSRAQLSVVMVDLDDFKRVNDTAGHAAGDQTLIAVGDILRRSRPGSSIAGRVGGEEFVVAMSGDRRDAIGLAERVRREIAMAPSRVTASIGVASASLFRVIPHDVSVHLDRLLEAADRGMYMAKRAGGNRVHVVGRPSDSYVEKPMASNTTATNGSAPWSTADRALSGAEASSTTAAASIGPTPAKSSAAPTRIPPEIVNPTPTAVTIAKNKL
jgi:diguanylate cyclase (GGDEF)-like protein